MAERPDPPMAEPKKRVAELIARLSSQSRRERAAASRLLWKLGPSIEPQLRGALRHEEPAVVDAYTLIPGTANSDELAPKALLPRYARNELDVLLSHLEELRQLKSSFVSLHYQDAPLTNLWSDLALQADTEVRVGWFYFDPAEWIRTNRITLILDHANYWDASRAIRDLPGLEGLGHRQNALTFTLSPSGPAPLARQSIAPSMVTGPFELTLSPGEPPTDPNPSLIEFTLRVTPEPKFQHAGTHARVHLDKCLDENGRSILRQRERDFASIESGWTIPFKLSTPRRIHRIKMIRGELSIAIGVPQRYLALTDPLHARGQSREFDGTRIAIQRVAVEDRDYTIYVDLSAPSGTPYTLNFPRADSSSLMLWDKSRVSINESNLTCVLLGIRRESGRDIASWRLSSKHPPEILTWLTPEETRWVTVPFAFNDVSAPSPMPYEKVTAAIDREDWDALRALTKPGMKANDYIRKWEHNPFRVGKLISVEKKPEFFLDGKPCTSYSFRLDFKNGSKNVHWLEILVREEGCEYQILDFLESGW
jgi:hypothetical protein